jgi:menaquinone-9 beta-reductase
MRRTPPLIVGGGPAGCAAAITLARGGTPPRLIDRAAVQPLVCGAFVSWDALAALDALGIDVWRLGARRITGVRILARGQIVEQALPAAAAGISRGSLDAALRERAEQSGATLISATAKRVDGDRVVLDDGAILEADALIVATGKHALRGVERSGPERNVHVGFRTEIVAPPGLDGWIELHLFNGGYAGLLMQEDGTANLCLSVRQTWLKQMGSLLRLLEILAQQSPRLGNTFASARSWSAIAGVSYGRIVSGSSNGLFRIGDQASVIASVVGDGLAIALASGRTAGAAYLGGGAAAAVSFQRGWAARARRPIRTAEALRHVAENPQLASLALRGFAALPGALSLASRITRIGA